MKLGRNWAVWESDVREFAAKRVAVELFRSTARR